MSDSPSLVVYLKPGCPWCVEVLDYLESEGFAYEGVDVTADPARFEEMRRVSGQTKAPTLTYGDLLLADCDVDEMREFFEKHGIRPAGRQG